MVSGRKEEKMNEIVILILKEIGKEVGRETIRKIVEKTFESLRKKNERKK